MKKLAIILFLFLAAPVINTGISATPNPDVELTEQIPVIKTVNGGIELTNNSSETITFHIYSITGQIIKSLELSGGRIMVDLPQGCYIVKCNKWSKKVVVR